MAVFALFWLLVYTGGTPRAWDVHAHGVNWVLMLCDRFFTEQPAYYIHFYQLQIYALVYVLFSIIHNYSGIDNGAADGSKLLYSQTVSSFS